MFQHTMAFASERLPEEPAPSSLEERLEQAGLWPLEDARREIPALARDPAACASISGIVGALDTAHALHLGDARDQRWGDQDIQLVVTSPPYWNLKDYPLRRGQLGGIADYEDFLAQLEDVWNACYDALAPGGRVAIVVGDVCLSRREHGRHRVVPLHAAIQEQCRHIGFDNLAPIFWYKVANLTAEGGKGSGGFLGKPYEPNSVLKNDVEYILMQRKPGGYRSPSLAARILSLIPKDLHSAWFRQVWDSTPGALSGEHPAPFPTSIAERLIRMFSFVGDTVMDPFLGSGSTLCAAAACGRHGVGIEIEPTYLAGARKRIAALPHTTLTISSGPRRHHA